MTRGDMQRVGAAAAAQIAIWRPSLKGRPPGKKSSTDSRYTTAIPGTAALTALQDFKTEARAIFKRAAIFVVAAVFERRMELRDQIAMGGMDFDAVEAGRSRAPRRGDMRRDRFADPRRGHFLRHDGLEGGLVDRVWNG